MKGFFAKYFKGDAVIWSVIIVLTIYSIMAVYSSTGMLAYKKHAGDTSHLLLKHSTILIFGLLITFIVHHFNFKIYMKLAPILLFISVPLLMFTLAIGSNLNDASRWLSIGGISFQTSDLGKLAIIMWTARILALKQGEITDFKTAFRPIIIPLGIVCLLVFPANFSTSAMIFVVILIMMIIGRISLKQIGALLGVCLIAGVIFAAIIIKYPNVLPRGETWKNRAMKYLGMEKEADTKIAKADTKVVKEAGDDEEDDFQVMHSKIAISSGGLIGKGPGHSTQRNVLPHPYSDFIFAIIVEEYGTLFGAIPILILYLFLLYRAGVILQKVSSAFGALLGLGLIISLVFQAFINMMVAVNLVPVTGQPLPLVSMGGTSIIFTSIALGIVLSISRSIKETDNEASVQDNN